MTHIRSNGSCTAVLIDPMTILTAGHCVEDLEQEEETALVNNRWKQNDFSIAVRANTRQMVLSSGSWSIRHSKFTDPPDWEYVDFDVAIIQLDACVEASSYAR
jgi:V8-like Glu-specific endopeptidase